MIKAFAYRSPKTVEQAVSDLGGDWGKVDILAGGTDLLALMKDGVAQPETVVNIKGISGLAGITVSDTSIRIGATTTLTELAAHAAVRKHLPALAEAAEVIGGPQIRNVGTVGGNLCQRPRDWYFRLGLDPEVKEETQYSAIFPQDGAIYVSPSTLAPALIVYGAVAHVAGPDGKREIPVEKFFKVSDLKSGRETALKPNEIVTEIVVPAPKEFKSADYEVRERDSHDWPLTQASVGLRIANGKVSEARIVLGHVGPTPVRAKAAEAALVGKELTAETAAAAGLAATEGARPLGKNGYKVTLTQVAVKRALLAAVGNAYWRT